MPNYSYVMVVCEDGRCRHKEAFTSLREAEQWADRGHACTTNHRYIHHRYSVVVTELDIPEHKATAMAVVATKLPSGRTVQVDAWGRGYLALGPDVGVNWPSIGTVDVRDTAAFAALLTFAAHIATVLRAHQCPMCQAPITDRTSAEAFINHINHTPHADMELRPDGSAQEVQP